MWRSILLIGGAAVVACGFVAGLLALSSRGNKVTDEPKLAAPEPEEEKPAEEVKEAEVAVPEPVDPAEEPRPKKSPKREAADRIKQRVKKINNKRRAL